MALDVEAVAGLAAVLLEAVVREEAAAPEHPGQRTEAHVPQDPCFRPAAMPPASHRPAAAL